MSGATFSVLLADVERRDQERSWDIPAAWLRRALEGTEAEPIAGHEGQLEVRVSKNGPRILVRGRVQTRVHMRCSRTLDPVEIDVDARVFLLLSQRTPAPEAAPRNQTSPRHARRKRQAAAQEATRTAPTRSERKRGRSRDDQTESLGDEDAAEDHFEGENIVLDDFVREHILLELPMFPVRSDLHSAPSPAIGPPADAAPEAAKPPDPRLAPLAALAAELKKKDKE